MLYKTWLGVVLFLIMLMAVASSSALAQAETEQGAQEQPQPQAEEPSPQAQGGEQEGASGEPADPEPPAELKIQNRSTEERPDPPRGALTRRDPDVNVVRSAGMGSDIAYAEEGVVELGGNLTLEIREEIVDMSFGPSIGYFFFDNIELTFLPFLNIVHADGSTAWRIGGILEPSYHAPITNWLYGFAGLGLGATYEEGPGFDALLRPVAGADILVGRSGILKPTIFMDVGLEDGAIGGGFMAQFTVML